jgi:hypothetical protein
LPVGLWLCFFLGPLPWGRAAGNCCFQDVGSLAYVSCSLWLWGTLSNPKCLVWPQNRPLCQWQFPTQVLELSPRDKQTLFLSFELMPMTEGRSSGQKRC